MRVFAPIATLRRRTIGAALTAVTSLALGACLDLNPNTEACSVTVAPTTITLAVNERVPIVGTAFDCDGASIKNKKISFSTGDPTIATVSSDGAVIGIAPGQTTVSAVANGKTGTAQVTVTAERANEVVLNPPSTTVRVGEVVRPFTPTIKNAQGIIISRPQQWSSSNSTVASVDQTGTITANAVGSANIVLQVDQVTTSAVVNVTAIRLASCAISPTTLRLTVTATSQPTLTARDTTNANANLLGRPFVWTSSDETVAGVSSTGVIQARKAGTATITAASAEYPNVNCRVDVTVADARVASILITQRGGFLRLGVPRVFSALVTDSVQNPITGRPPVWTTDTPGTISVSSLGVVTPQALGTARIIARVDDKADTLTMQVTRVPISRVRLTPATATIEERGTTIFAATVEDSTGNNVTDRPLQWFANNPTLVTITPSANTQSVTVTGVASGSTTINALTDENVLGAAQLVILPLRVDTITVEQQTITVRVGQTTGFTITLLDANGNELRNRRVSTVSNLPGVANVPNSETTTSTVVVQGISPGEAIITLQALNLNGQAEGKRTLVRVTVVPPGGD